MSTSDVIRGAVEALSATHVPVIYFVEVGGERFEALEVRGEEALSKTCRFEVSFRLPPGHALDPESTTGGEATLVVARGHDVRRIKRVVTDTVRGATQKRFAGTSTVTLTLEPRLATLRFRVDIRVYRDKTSHQIAREVLTDLGVAVEERLGGSYAQRGYCVQMRESDLDFAQRLLEDDGIGYFVEDDDTVVFFDNVSAYGPSTGVLFYTAAPGMERAAEVLYEVGLCGEVTPGKISLRDFNHEHPRLDMDVSAPGPWQDGPEWYDYPGEYAEPAEGKLKAERRAEALACAAESLVGKSYSPALRPGATFVLARAPIGVSDGGYVLRSVEHAWRRDDQGFAVTITAQRDDVSFRPLVATPIPRLTSPLTGFATGPAGADIHTDEWGRAKVHFPWDRRQPKDDHCSDWVPVLQDNTGHSVGIARVGWELVCHFLEGDPDRPVVVGRVFNEDDPFPETLPMHKTKTALRSLTSPRPVAKDGTLERNEILFEDMKGHEEIRMLAQRDQRVIVANDKLERVDDLMGSRVDGNETVTIGEENHVDVKINASSTVGVNQAYKVGGSRKVEVKGSQSEDVGADHTLTIGGSHMRRIGETDVQQVEKTFKETIGGVVLEASVKTNKKSGSRLSAVTVGGAIIELARMSKSESVGKIRVETAGGLAFIKAGKEIATRVGRSRRTMVGAAMMVEALKQVAISGAEKLSMKSASATWDGAKVLTIRVGETEVTLRDGVLLLKSPKEITFKADAKNSQNVGEARQQ
jgi:type VI secretion system secreted protein VgrG